MCTVLFIPKGNSYFLASLRDENPGRLKAFTPHIQLMDGLEILSPVDALAGGTWIGINGLGNAIVLLNGAFENHERKKNYGRSRGLIVKEMLGSVNTMLAWGLMGLQDIEPCTLIVFFCGNLYQLTWDGQQKHELKLPNGQCHIWSSSTLYDKNAKQYRSELFEQWAKSNTIISYKSVLDFFESYTEDMNGFIMNRNETIKTLSYSFVEIGKQGCVMHYHDFIANEVAIKELAFKIKTGY